LTLHFRNRICCCPHVRSWNGICAGSLFGKSCSESLSFRKTDLPLPSQEDLLRHLLKFHHPSVSQTGSHFVLKWQGVETLGVPAQLSYCVPTSVSVEGNRSDFRYVALRSDIKCPTKSGNSVLLSVIFFIYIKLSIRITFDSIN
jgi:hypothetical protein